MFWRRQGYLTGKQINTVAVCGLSDVSRYRLCSFCKVSMDRGSKDFSCKVSKQMALKCRQTRLLVFLNKNKKIQWNIFFHIAFLYLMHCQKWEFQMKIDLKLRLGRVKIRCTRKACVREFCFHYVIQNIICKCVSSKIFLLCETNWNAGIQLNIWLNILYLWHVHLMLLLWVAIVLLSCWANLFWDLESDTWIFCFWEKIQAMLFICGVPNASVNWFIISDSCGLWPQI